MTDSIHYNIMGNQNGTVSVSTCANCHVQKRSPSHFTDPLNPPHGNPIHAINWPKDKNVDPSKCHAYQRWPTFFRKENPVVQQDSWQIKQNFLNVAAVNKTRFTPTFRSLKAKACIDLSSWNGGLGPWYTKLFARMSFFSGARICFTLRGDHRGLIFNEYYNPIATIKGLRLYAGVPIRYEYAWPKEVNIYNSTPQLETRWKQCDLFFWCKEETLIMNPLRKFGDKIPVYYRPSDGRRLTLEEAQNLCWSSQLNECDIAPIPLLAKMVSSKKLPRVIPYNELFNFFKVWSKTWSKTRKPKNRKERITHDAVKSFSQNSMRLKAKILVSPDAITAPGFFVKFKNVDPPELQYVQSKGWPYRPDNSYMATIDLKSRGLGQMPYQVTFQSKAKLEQIYLRGFFDLGTTSADVNSTFSIDKEGSEFDVALNNIYAKINPFDYGVLSTGGKIADGRSTEFFPAGFHLTKNKNGDLSGTINLDVKNTIETSRGSFTMSGNVLASLNARWTLNKLPQIKAGKTYIEIKNFSVQQKGEFKPLISNARLIITDSLNERKILAVAHPRFRCGNSGFIVRLELSNLEGLGYQQGYVVGFIPVPRDSDDRFYDPDRFSLQQTMNIAFGLVAKNRKGEIKGALNISKLDSGTGIKVRGNVISISGSRARHLIKNGSMKLMTRLIRDKKGKIKRQWYAVVQMDYLKPKRGIIYQPFLSARFSTSINKNTIKLDMKKLIAKYSRIRFGRLSTGQGILSSKFKLAYDRREKLVNLWRLSTYLNVKRIAPHSLLANSQGRITSFDIDGHLAGHWLHNLKTNRGKGWLALMGDKEGDLHLRDKLGKRVGSRRLGRQTPLFSNTRWVALRIDGVDRRGWINGQFCLRTDVDLMALRSMGVRYSDYFEWTMSHDNIALLKGISARSDKYYRDLLKGKLPTSGTSRRGDICKRIFSRIK